MAYQNLTGVPAVWDQLGLGAPAQQQAASDADKLRRKKKLMAAAETQTDPMAQYGSASAAILGYRSATAPM